MGKKEEDKLFEVLTNDNFIVQKTDRWRWNDFEIINKTSHKKYKVELKKRVGINKNTFDTTILPFSKIIEWRKVKKKYDDFLLMFSFKDGTYHIPYSTVKKLKKTDKRIKVDIFQRKSGFVHNKRLHLFIPTEHLIPLNELSVNT